MQKELQEDNHIIESFFDRDESAIQLTDRKYGRYLKKIARNIVKDARDAEECVWDVYFKVWNSIPPARPAHFRAYLVTLVRRSAISLCRRKQAEKRGGSYLEVPWEDCENLMAGQAQPEDAIEQKEAEERTERFLQSLPDRQRYIFLSRFYLGYEIREIAGKLNVKKSTVYAEIQRLKQQYQRMIEEGRS